MLSHLVAWNMDWLELPHHRQTGKFQGVVFLGLAFDIGPAPGFFVGTADQRGELELLAQIGDPAAGAAGFHDDQVDRVVLEHSGQVAAGGGHQLKPGFLGIGVEKAAHRVELAQIDCENNHDESPWFGGELCDTPLQRDHRLSQPK